MTDTVISASPGWSLERAAVEMARRHIRHLVVVENGELVGVLSMRDIVRVWTSDGATASTISPDAEQNAAACAQRAAATPQALASVRPPAAQRHRGDHRGRDALAARQAVEVLTGVVDPGAEGEQGDDAPPITPYGHQVKIEATTAARPKATRTGCHDGSGT